MSSNSNQNQRRQPKIKQSTANKVEMKMKTFQRHDMTLALEIIDENDKKKEKSNFTRKLKYKNVNYRKEKEFFLDG